MTGRVLSIAAVQITGALTTFLFLVLLADADVVVVVTAMSIAGMISGTVASNNTTKIFTHLSGRQDIGDVVALTLRLFWAEQVLAVAMALAVSYAGLEVLDSFSTIEILLFAILSSNGALIAFCKFRHRVFILMNCLRVVGTLFRLAAVLAVARAGHSEWIPEIIIVSLALPFGFSLFAGLGVNWRTGRGTGRVGPAGDMRVTLREYLFGLPGALIRSFMTKGVLVLAAANLTEDALRMFRFLLMPAEIIGRLFNSALPIVFDRLFAHQLRLGQSAVVLAASVSLALVWFWIGERTFAAAGWSAAPSYVAFLALNASVYAFLPVVWRAVYRNRAFLGMSAVLSAGAVALMFLWQLPLEAMRDFFIVMNAYTLTYLVGVGLIGRSKVGQPS